MDQLLSALALVAIIEGLVLFAMPDAWRRTMEATSRLEPRRLRALGGWVLIAGLVSLWLVRGS